MEANQMRKKARIRAGLIGAGGIANTHAKALTELADAVDFRAVSEIDEKRGLEFQQKYSIPKFYRDYRELLADREIDVVTICTPAFNHALITCAALEAGKWAICEKPVGGSIREVDTILAAERKTGLRAASIYQNRASRGMRALAELIRTGKAGRPLIGLCETFWQRDHKTYYDTAPWRGTWKGEMGGCLVTLAIHIIDGLLSVMGDASWLCADAANLNHRIEVDDCSATTVHFKNGSMASIIATSCNHENSSRLRIVFENMTALSHEEAYSYGKLPWRFFSADKALQKEIDACYARWNADACPESHKGQLLHFVNAFRNQTEPMAAIRDARKSLELIAGIYKSSITGERVRLPIAKSDPFYSAMNGGKKLRGAVKKPKPAPQPKARQDGTPHYITTH